MPDWALAIAVVIGTIIGASIGEFRHWREGRQRYQVMTFEKRLEAHQQAYYWCHKLNEVLNASDAPKIHQTATEAREWWNGNCLFLDANSRRETVKLINLAHFYADGHKTGEYVWSSLMTAMRAIIAGIGIEYLPEMSELPEELQETM